MVECGKCLLSLQIRPTWALSYKLNVYKKLVPVTTLINAVGSHSRRAAERRLRKALWKKRDRFPIIAILDLCYEGNGLLST